MTLTLPVPAELARPLPADTVDLLRRGHLSRRRLLLGRLVHAAREQGHWPPDTDRAWRRLVTAEAADPVGVARALADPFAGVWVDRTARRRPASTPTADGAPLLPDLAELTAWAAGDPAPGWAAGVPMAFGDGDPVLRIRLDDRHPLRDCFGPPGPPLSPSDQELWRDLLGQAWELLTAHDRAQARTVADVLQVITPLARTPDGDGRSVSARAAFGATGVSLPDDPALLAATLIHETGHSVLNGVMDLVPLCVRDGSLYYSPWRDDPRPLTGLLHGAFAFHGVARFWQRLAGAVPDPTVTRQASRSAAQVRDALDALAGVGSLTAYGRELVAALAAVAAGWEVAVDAEVSRELAAHRVRWRVANLRPAAAAVAELAEGFLAGAAPPSREVPVRLGQFDAGLFPADPAGADPADGDAVVEGLTTAGAVHHAPPAALRSIPEVVRAVWSAVAAAGVAAEPATVAHWLAGVTTRELDR